MKEAYQSMLLPEMVIAYFGLEMPEILQCNHLHPPGHGEWGISNTAVN